MPFAFVFNRLFKLLIYKFKIICNDYLKLICVLHMASMTGTITASSIVFSMTVLDSAQDVVTSFCLDSLLCSTLQNFSRKLELVSDISVVATNARWPLRI